MVQGVTTASYQYPRTSRNKTSFVDTHQSRINQINYFSNRHHSNFLSTENRGSWVGGGGALGGGGWHCKPNNDSFITRDLGSFVEKEHNHFSQPNTLPDP